MESSNPKTIIIYGTSWCGDTRRTRSYFARNNIEYQWVDIDYDGQKCTHNRFSRRRYSS
jgi:glutaredoxin-related protein